MSGEAIELERFAAIAAEIEHGAPSAEVLAREGIAAAAWGEAQEEWLAKLAEETAERESSELNTRYQKAFGERLAALEKEAKARPAAAKVEAAAAEETPEEPDLGAAEETEVEPAAAPAAVVVPAAMGASNEVSPWAAGAAVPAVPAVAAAREEPKGGKAEPKTAAFAAIPGPASLRGALPFQAPAAAPAAPPVSMRSGLPFQAAPTQPAAPQRSSAVPPVPAAQGSAQTAAPRLTLEQFAQLSAELAAAPASQAAIAARFGLDPAGPAIEHQAWQARFAHDRALYERFRVLYQHYAGWLASSRR